jgi:O-antigen biosynthesis protein WbqP
MHDFMKGLFDPLLLSLVLSVLAAPLVLVAALVRITSKRPSSYWSVLVGRDNRIFQMLKFRTMRLGTPAVATHLLNCPESYLTPMAPFCVNQAWTSSTNSGAFSKAT